MTAIPAPSSHRSVAEWVARFRRPRREPYLRLAGRPHPADLGPPGAARRAHRRRPRRGAAAAHGARPRGADGPGRRRHGHRRPGDQLRHRDHQRPSRARAGAADRRLPTSRRRTTSAAAGTSHAAILRPVTRGRTLRVAGPGGARPDRPCMAPGRRANPPGPVYPNPDRRLRQTVPPACVLDEHLRPDDASAGRPDAGSAGLRGGGCCCAARRPARRRRPRRPQAGAEPPARPTARSISTRRRAAGWSTARTIVGRRRGAREGDDRGRPRARRRPQARLPDGLRLAGGLPQARRFVRIADHADELRDNRRGEVELLADPAPRAGAKASRRVPASRRRRLDTGLDRRALRPSTSGAHEACRRPWPRHPPARTAIRPQPHLRRGTRARCWPDDDHHRRRRRPALRPHGAGVASSI